MTGPTRTHRPAKLFISYSHKDERFRQQLEEHLYALKRRGLIEEWHDRKITPGQEWEGVISENLEASEIIMLLISSSFISSPYCYETEMARALQKYETGEACVIPVILRPVDWSDAPFSHLQALPKNGRPVSRWSNRDEAWVDVSRGIRQAIEDLASDRLPETQEPEREAVGDTKAALLDRQEQAVAAGEFLSFANTRPGGPLSEEAAASSNHNLPAQRSSFVGRERELAEVKRALTMTRLLTLTGAGGSGKTRLALEAARSFVGTYPDGVWLVELAPLSEEVLVPQAVADSLSVREQPGQTLTDTLVDFLREKRLLLFLDNCEHLIEAAAQLADALLDRCPHLRVLTTSREVLEVDGEVLWRVPPLSVPETDGPSAGELSRYDAACLFVDRARLRASSFELTPAHARAIAHICRTLEGMPLAIELAAARVGALSVEQISERLKHSLKLLTGGGRTVTPRQRTLRGALNWSYDLLSESEKKVFERLSVFAGGWTLGAAEAVASGDSIEEGEVLDLLSALVDKSLVLADSTSDAQVRYRMLEPVRHYAQVRLEDGGDSHLIRQRHLEHYLAKAEDAELELIGPRQQSWLDRLEQEHDNLRVALSRSLEGGDELGLRLGAALWRFWYMRGYLSEGRRWLEDLVRHSSASSPVRAKAVIGEGWLAEMQGDYERARAAYEDGLELYRRWDDEKGVASSLAKLGSATLSLGEHEQARALLEASLELLRKLGDSHGVINVLNTLGSLASSQGDRARALALHEEALSLSRKIDDAQGVAIALGNLGFTTLVYGDRKRATILLEQSLALFREIGDTLNVAVSLVNVGLAMLAAADHERAMVLFRESLTMSRELGDKLGIAESLEGMAAVSAASGRAERAPLLWSAAQSLREDIGAPLQSDERIVLEPHFAAAHSSLTEEAWVVGRKMTLEEVIEYALSMEQLASSVYHATEQSSIDS